MSPASTLMSSNLQNSIRTDAIFQRLAQNALIGLYVQEGDRFRFVNAKLAEMLCYTRDEMIGSLSIFSVVVRDERHLAEADIKREASGEVNEIHYECKACRKDGSLIDIELFGSRMKLDGKAVIVGMMLDITRRKDAENSIVLSSLHRRDKSATVVTDANGVILTINPAFSDITGYALDEVVGQRLSILNSGRQDAAVDQAMWHAIETTGKWQGDLWHRHKSGAESTGQLSISTSYNDDGSIRCRIGVFSDTAQSNPSDQPTWQQLNYDHLTGLPNRNLFRDRLMVEMARARRTQSRVALLYLDLDFFKEANEALGHAAGDELLKQAGLRLTHCVRDSDTVARLEGDVFAIIVGALEDGEVVDRICQEILHRLAASYTLKDNIGYLSASIGVAFYPQDGLVVDDVLGNAELASYTAKQLGRSQYNFYTPVMQESAKLRWQLAQDLTSALAENQFELYYQPIIDFQTGRVISAEALLRWNHPAHGVINPAKFIPFAEDTGMIVSIGDWVFKEAARQVAEWHAGGSDIKVSINVSPAQFRSQGISQENWLAYLNELNVSGHSIIVEITERLLMDIGAGVTEKLLALRAAGIQVALDDFGTGYSSLSYLKKFDIDYIKIDQSFVQNVALGSDDMALCEAIIVMAHQLGLKIVAEGIETTGQRDLLAEAGCDYGQGYLFARPMPVAQLTPLLKASRFQA